MLDGRGFAVTHDLDAMPPTNNPWAEQAEARKFAAMLDRTTELLRQRTIESLRRRQTRRQRIAHRWYAFWRRVLLGERR